MSYNGSTTSFGVVNSGSIPDIPIAVYLDAYRYAYVKPRFRIPHMHVPQTRNKRACMPTSERKCSIQVQMFVCLIRLNLRIFQ